MLILLCLLPGDPVAILPAFVETISSALLVAAFDPLRIKLQWRNALLEQCRIPYYEVDGFLQTLSP